MSEGATNVEGERNAPELARLWKAHIGGTDPTAFDRIHGLLAERLFYHLRRKFPVSPEADIEDAVAEAFGYVAADPARYDPEKASLFYFLTVVGGRRIVSMWRRQKRLVALEPSDANNTPEQETPDPAADTEADALRNLICQGRDPYTELPPPIAEWLETVLPEQRDRTLFQWTVERRAQVAEFAALYELTDEPLEFQQREMKRHRDRIQKRVLRGKAGLQALLDKDEDGNRR